MDQDLIVAGVSLGAFIILVVQALKVTGVVPAEKLGMAPWITAAVFLALFGVESAYPPAAPYIETVLKAAFGAVSAVLIYFYGAKPVFKSIGSNLTSDDLE